MTQESIRSQPSGEHRWTTSGEADLPSRCPRCDRSFASGIRVCPHDGTPLEEPQSGDPLVGALLGGSYRVTESLAAGGMGQVYLAEHARLERRLVVKILHESHAHSKAALERAEREARATSRIRSPHVVELVDFVRAPDGRPGIVMPFLDGEDLHERLERLGKLKVADAARIAMEICTGLIAAHATGVVHRDLKPSNVFLARLDGGGERATILDFGVAKLADVESNLTQAGGFVGTPAYMAPEQALRASTVDARADVYAVGAVLYHMLVGQPPYGREDATTTFMALLKGEPPKARSIEPSVPEALEALLEQAMARELSARVGSAEELRSRLAPFAGPSAASRIAPSAPVVESPSRERTLPTVKTERPGAPSRFARPRAIAQLLAGSVVGAAWLAAFGAAVLFDLRGEAIASTLDARFFALVPLLAAVVLFGGALFALGQRWQSPAEIERLSLAARRGTMAGLFTLGLVELVVRAAVAVSASPKTPTYLEVVIGLGLAAVVGIVVFGRARRLGAPLSGGPP
jgi:serine/threonine-protein kinase